MHWSTLAVKRDATALRCPTCAKSSSKLGQHVQQVQLLHCTALLASAAVNVLGEIVLFAHHTQYLLTISDRFTTFTKSVPLKNTSALEVAKAFVHYRVLSYGSPSEL